MNAVNWEYQCLNTYSLTVCPETEGRLIIIIDKLPLEICDPRHWNMIRNSPTRRLCTETEHSHKSTALWDYYCYHILDMYYCIFLQFKHYKMPLISSAAGHRPQSSRQNPYHNCTIHSTTTASAYFVEQHLIKSGLNKWLNEHLCWRVYLV